MRLNEEEHRFITYLASRGGSAYLSEIRRALGLPHTSAWRIARRLNEIGFVRTAKVKVGGRELLKIVLRKRRKY